MALKALQKKWKYHQVVGKVVPVTRYPSRGRPAGGATPQIVGFRLAGEVRTSEHLLEQARRGQGRFVLATNECQSERLPSKAMLSQYKSQAFSVERGRQRHGGAVQKHCWRRYTAFKSPTLPHGEAVSAERTVGRTHLGSGSE